MVDEMGEDGLLAPGARLGSFIIKERLLDRTFWETYLAVESETGQEAEVQCEDARGGEHVPGREEFLEGLERVRKIEHVAVPKVLSGGVEGSIHWIARAWVLGVSVLSFRTEVSPPTMAEALTDGAFFAAGLDAVSKAGIVHGNVTPRVCVITHGKPMVLDVGSRALFGLSQEDVMATPLYRAPEQLMAKPIDARADVYSLGMILYEILAGQAPFSREAAASPEALAMAILTKMPEAPDPQRVHPAVASIIEAMCAKDAGARYGIERACGALCTIVRFLQNDTEHAAAAAAHKQKRSRERGNLEYYFESHPAHAVSSGYRVREKEGTAEGQGRSPEPPLPLTPLPTSRSVEGAAPLEGAPSPLPEVEEASRSSPLEGELPELSEPLDLFEASEPSPQTLPSGALRRRRVAPRWRRAIALVGGLSTLVLLVCVQRAFERRVEARGVPVLSKAARLVETVKVGPLLEPNAVEGSPPVTEGAPQGGARADAGPLAKDQPKAAARGARRAAAPARVAPSAALSPLFESDAKTFMNDWD